MRTRGRGATRPGTPARDLKEEQTDSLPLQSPSSKPSRSELTLALAPPPSLAVFHALSIILVAAVARTRCPIPQLEELDPDDVSFSAHLGRCLLLDVLDHRLSIAARALSLSVFSRLGILHPRLACGR